MEKNLRRAIAIDFDGTLCADKYPSVGEPFWDVINKAKQEQENGAELILWTCREGVELERALEACEKWGLHFDAINESTPSWKEAFQNDPRKVGASEYWDDKAVRISKATICLTHMMENLPVQVLEDLTAPVWCVASDGTGEWCLCTKGQITRASGEVLNAKDMSSTTFHINKTEF